MKFLDFFSGIGGFRRGMELAGHTCVGFCEADKFALASYTAMHLMTEEERAYLATLPKSKRIAEVGGEEYRHGEWYANDIRRIFAEDIPRADIWCFGFPCQDISAAGKQLGFGGQRSSLFFRVMRLIQDLEEKDRPTYLLIENVKNLLRVHGGWDFLKLLLALDESGYDAEWQVLNSKDFGVPQNRERVFVIGYLRGRSCKQVFPIEGAGGENSVRQVMLPAFFDMSYGAGLQTYETAFCLQARYNKGICNRRGEMSGVCVPATDGAHAMQHEDYGQVSFRKLTPRECFRLQGWTDDYFNRAALVNSDSRLYQQAGNGVTVPVVEEIARKLED